jgi:hypothetical protein
VIAKLNREPRYAAPTSNSGPWLYVEIEVEAELAGCKDVQTLRGWVNVSAMRGRCFADWLTDELLVKMAGLARVQRHVRKTRDAAADYTSRLLATLCSVALLANV